MDVYFKDSVDPGRPTPEILRALVIVAGVCDGFGIRFTVTSMQDGRHSANSLHYRGGICRAFDMRTRDEGPGYAQWSDDLKRQLADAIRNALGKDYDVVVERTHIHIEYDPK